MPNGECRYFLTDQVDSVNVVLNDKGDAVTRTEYKPYGETWLQEGDKTNRPKFNSQELDPETGYYFYNARYYEAEIGRFVTADNVIDGEYSTQGWNRFSYVKNNPVRYKDPTGHDYEDAKGNTRRGETGQDTPVKGGEFGWKPLEQGGDISTGPPGKIIGEQLSNQEIGDLARNLEQRPGGAGQKVLDEAFGSNQASSATYCATNSLFLGIAKLGLIEPTMEGYKKYVKYAVEKGYIRKRNGFGVNFKQLANDYGVDYQRTFTGDSPSPGDKYIGLQSTEGTVFMLNSSGHWVTSVTGGTAEKEYSFDTGNVRNIGKRQMRGGNRLYPRDVDDLIILKRR